MSLLPQEDIDLEIHDRVDQFIRVEKGCARVYIGKDQKTYKNLTDGDVIIIPAKTWHRVKNTSHKERLSLYTIYAPPEHPQGLRQRTAR